MSYQEDRFLEIANAIRAKDGTTAPIKATDFADRIEAIPSGGGAITDEYYYQVAQVLISANRFQYLDEAWDSRSQITVNASGNVTGVTGTLNDIVIPKEALAIPDAAWNANPFYPHRQSAKSLTLPSDLGLIGIQAFQGCSGLTGSLIIPNSVTSIGSGAFFDCSSLTSVVIGNSVTSIGEHAFHGCGSLVSIIIPDGVTSIGNSAFQSCESLESVVIGDGVTSIGDHSFIGCRSLTIVEIPDGVTSIGNNLFESCYSLKSVVIGNSVTSIGNDTFQYCDSLESVVIGDGVTSIGYTAFSNCVSLTNVVMPNGLLDIGYSAFSGCTSVLNYDFSTHTTVPTLTETGAFYDINTNCRILVPAALESEWKAETNWVAYADYIVGV